MKKVIRLIEYDLTRIVKRVLEEEAEVIKIKTWDTKEDRDNNLPRKYNMDTTNHKLINNTVYFDGTIVGTDTKIISPGGGTIGHPNAFSIRCGDMSGLIELEQANYITGNNLNSQYITDAARKLLTKKCDSYVSKDTKVNGNYA